VFQNTNNVLCNMALSFKNVVEWNGKAQMEENESCTFKQQHAQKNLKVFKALA